MALLSLFLLWLTSHVAANRFIEPKNRPEIVSRIKQVMFRHSHALTPPPNETDLCCKCNDKGCDAELIHIGGEAFAGICRVPEGGMCHTVENFNELGQLSEIHLDCLHEANLLPPNRPFQCHTNEDHPRIRLRCCNNSSLCNDVKIPELAPRKIQETVTMSFFVICLIIAAVIFSGFGLCLGIFWLSNKQTKTLFRRLMARIPYINSLTGASQRRQPTAASPRQEGEVLIEMDDTEAFKPDLALLEQTDSSGYGLASLSKRTIARQIHLKKSIAKGRFGEVWLGDWKNEQVAVKIFNSRDEKSWWRETDVYTTNTLRHTNILRWIASDNKDAGSFTQLWLVTEWMELGSLCDYLEVNTVDKRVGMQMMRGIAHGLSYLHTEVPGIQNQCYKPPIAHRDLKSKNILVKNDLDCVIADLGLAVRNIHGKMEEVEDKRVGTIRYLAPELLAEVPAKKFITFTQGDVYATALIFWEICRRINYKSADSGSFDYQLPYFEHIDRDPSVEDMAVIVVERNLRPTIDQDWYANPMMSELVRIMEESWTEKAASRLTALNIRNNMDRLAENEDYFV